MKKRFIAVLLSSLLLLLTLASCSGREETPPPADDGTGDGTEKDYGSYVWGGDATPCMIIDRSVPEAQINSIFMAVSKAALVSPDYYYTDTSDIIEEGAHEIVVGNNTGRSITRMALHKLREVKRESEGDVAYLVYARRGSVAIVADEDNDDYGFIEGIAAFIEECVNGNRELKLTSGVVLSGTVNPLEIYKESDNRYYEEAWAKLADAVGEDGASTVEALKGLYSIYDRSVVTWFANLYDPAIGGFYYSNSARDSGFYAPDTESTCQALGFISTLGSVRTWRTGVTAKYNNIISEERRNEIVVYIKSLQDENGFFYNYQWDKSATDAQHTRRARDLSWCLSILSALGARPTYNTPNGATGDGKKVEGTYDPTILMQAPIRVGTSTAVAVSKVTLAAHAPEYESVETLKTYLAKLDERNSGFYSIGSTITSQMNQIIARDKELREAFYGVEENSGKDYVGLVATVIAFFNEHQDPETGLWGHDAKQEANYAGVNGLLKISGIYNDAGIEIRYAEKAARAAIDAISSDEKMGAVVDLYNTWFSISNILTNLRQFGSVAVIDGVEYSGIERAELIRASLREVAAPAILKSAEKISEFKKEDGSFSYLPDKSSSTSQGMPVAIPGTNEGDVNATVIATTGIVGNICSALGIPSVAIYGEADLKIFLDIFENLGPVIKHTPLRKHGDEPVTFDFLEVGDTKCELGGSLPDGGFLIEKDTREGASGNTVRLTSDSTTEGGTVTSRNNNDKSKDGNCYIFEADIRVNSGKYYFLQITMGTSYMFSLKVEDGMVVVFESTTASNTSWRTVDVAKIPLGKWFHLRVEYYKNGKDGSPRACYYIDGKLTAVTDGFFGMAKKADGTYGGTPNTKPLSETKLYKMRGEKLDMNLDNVYTTSKDMTYQPSNAKDLVYNVDGE